MVFAILLYPVLYKSNRTECKTTILVPDAGGLLVESATFSLAVKEAQAKAADFFKQAKSKGERINRPSCIDDLLKLTAYKGWSAAWIEMAGTACAEETEQAPLTRSAAASSR